MTIMRSSGILKLFVDGQKKQKEKVNQYFEKIEAMTESNLEDAAAAFKQSLDSSQYKIDNINLIAKSGSGFVFMTYAPEKAKFEQFKISPEVYKIWKEESLESRKI